MPQWGRWVKRIVQVIVILVVVLAAGVYVLFVHRSSLPDVPARQRVAPSFSALPAMSACWVETGAMLTSTPMAVTMSGILVHHPAGDLLIDTGISSHFDEEISGYPFWTRLRGEMMLGPLAPDIPIPELLHLMGQDPSKLRWVVVSHGHLDHVGGLMDLPRVPVLLPKEELDFLADTNNQKKGFVIAEHSRLLHDGRAHPVEFRPKPYEIFEESADLYGDGSVVVVPLRGHTPGSVGVFVNLSPSKRMFHVGDAVDDARGFQDRVGKSLLLQKSDADPARANQIVGVLYNLHRMLPDLVIIPAHGRSEYKKAFPGGPLSCVKP
ncbi:MAG TPA: MBL fold metallo-hydrolase [Candidatus Acidoferrales bacterium]|nr:MBL fold metallo-hydrolase [Candidatus Acidoferrales bacterium]